MNQNKTTKISKKCLRKMAAWNTEKLTRLRLRPTSDDGAQAGIVEV